MPIHVDESIKKAALGASVTAALLGADHAPAIPPAPPLALTMDWAPVANTAERAEPKILVPSGPNASLLNDGTTLTTPYNAAGQGLRQTYPRNADTWAQVSGERSTMEVSQGPSSHGMATSAQDTGPLDNTVSWYFTYNTSLGIIAIRSWTQPEADDQQDIATFRRSVNVWIDTTGQIGKIFDLQTINNFDNFPAHTILKSERHTIDAAAGTTYTDKQGRVWQGFSIDWDAQSQMDGPPEGWVTIANVVGDPNTVTAVRVAIPEPRVWNSQGYLPERARPMPWHDTLGVLSQGEAWNAWYDSDDPLLYGGATKAASAIAAPDSADYLGGRTLQLYTVPAGAGFTTPANVHIDQISDVTPSNISTSGLWLTCWIKPSVGGLPADNAFRAYVTTQSGKSYGPVGLVRDTAAVLRASDGAAFYRAYVRTSTRIVSATQVGGDYVVTTDQPHQMIVAEQVKVDFHSVANFNTDASNIPWTIAAVTPTTFSVATTPGANGTDGRATPNADLNFTVKIQNDSGAQLQFYAYRFCASEEDDRQTGHDSVLVPKRAITAPVQNNCSFITIIRHGDLVQMRHGIWIVRQTLLRYALGEVCRPRFWGGPAFWQGGPKGSADSNFDCGIEPGTSAVGPQLLFQCRRGSPANGSLYNGWDANIQWPAGSNGDTTLFPAGVDIDLALAWNLDTQLLDVGIGTSVGTGITWLDVNTPFLGGTVTKNLTLDKLDWEIGVDNGSAIGLGADRDIIRQHGGFLRGIGAAKLIDVATARQSIESYIASRWGARQNHN